MVFVGEQVVLTHHACKRHAVFVYMGDGEGEGSFDWEVSMARGRIRGSSPVGSAGAPRTIGEAFEHVKATDRRVANFRLAFPECVA